MGFQPQGTPRDYVVALSATALVVAIRGLLDPILGNYQPVGLLYAAVAISIWQGSLLPTAISCAAGYIASNILFIEPRGRFALQHPHDWMTLAGYVTACGVVIVMGESLRRSRRQLSARILEGNRVEHELAATRHRIQIVTDSMSALVTRCNRNYEYEWVSKPYADYVGLPPEEIVGRKIVDVAGTSAFERVRPRFDQVLAGSVVRFEEELQHPRLGPRWISAVYTPTRDARGEVDGWVAVVSDVDQVRRAQQALQDADRRKNEFLAMLAHELRGPLVPIRNAAHLLHLGNPSQKELQGAGDIIDRQINQIVSLVDDLLDISRITQGRFRLHRSRIELGPVVETAVEACRPIVASRQHALTVTIPSDPIVMEADPIRLNQILTNLLHNAARYTDPGGFITVSVDRSGAEVVVAVRDTGSGIRTEDLESIFDLFAQRSQDASRSEGGLGIGLALVRSLVELHGGSVVARSEGLGRGSEFVVRLPTLVSPVEAAASQDAGQASAGTLFASS